MTLDNTLYDILCGKTANIKLKPDLFINKYEMNGDDLIFNTDGYYTKSFVHGFKLYIPFSQNGNLMSDYNNGIYKVYPLYTILIINTPSLTDFSSAYIEGAYSMSENRFEPVLLNEELEIVSEYEARIKDITTITRYVPIKATITPAMNAFIDGLINGTVKLKYR